MTEEQRSECVSTDILLPIRKLLESFHNTGCSVANQTVYGFYIEQLENIIINAEIDFKMYVAICRGGDVMHSLVIIEFDLRNRCL